MKRREETGDVSVLDAEKLPGGQIEALLVQAAHTAHRLLDAREGNGVPQLDDFL